MRLDYWNLFLISLAIPLLFFGSCTDKKELAEEVKFDLKDIKGRGKLIALTSYGPTSYFIYRGETMGYEYELLKRLAEHLEVELEIKVARNLNELDNMLRSGEGDIIAHSLAVTNARKEKYTFTNEHRQTQQMLIQRKPEGWETMPEDSLEKSLIRDTTELAGLDIYVRRYSSYYSRLTELSENIDGAININEVPGTMETGKIIQKVAEGEYDYTVADKNIALITNTNYNNLDIQTPVSKAQDIAWAVRHSSQELLQEVNNWLAEMKDGVDYYVIYNKYFKNREAFQERTRNEFSSVTGQGKISPYDSIFKYYADSVGWDWKLLAAQAYQESRFDPNTKSWAGAMGLMQLMPRTARSLGITSNLFQPEPSVKAGTRYIRDLQEMWSEIENEEQRLKFILASYNVGPYHVKDAQRLAKKLNKDPQIWDKNVEECILLKSREEYFNDEVVKYGYCRGIEPVNYVKEIQSRYNRYKDLFEDQEV